MPKYYNRTRGPLPVTLRTGESAMVPPKSELVVTPEQDRSASILSRVRKKLLVPLKDEPTPQPEPEPVPEPEPTPEPVEVPSMDWTKAQLTEHAEAMGLEVPSTWTKVEILNAIEGEG